MTKRIFAVLMLILLPHLAQAATAQSAWQDEDFASVRVLSARDGIKDVHSLRLGLEFSLQPHWKVYWRSAGDAGFPPKTDWTGSTNIDATGTTMLWPAPVRFSIFGLETFGYENRVIFPIDVPVLDPSQPVDLHLSVDYLACSDICVPATAVLNLSLPADRADISSHAHEIEKFAAKVPLRGDNLPIGVSDIWENSDAGAHGVTGTSGDSGDSFLDIALRDVAPDVTPDILVEGKPTDSFGPPLPTGQTINGAPVYRLTIHNNAKAASFAGQHVTVTVLAGDLAVEQPVTIGTTAPTGLITNNGAGGGTAATASPAPKAAVGQSPAMAWWVIGGLALLGGLILNVMPCVLPVLSIKVMGAIKLGAENRASTRRGFIASALGILVSFWIIAGALGILKLAGGSIGWGIQFQQPLFLTVMTIIVVLFACNMFGLFEISANRLNDLANDTIDHHQPRTGDSQTGKEGMGGHFLTGMFATLLATPCSAPFLGTAVGFALAGTIFDIFWIFTLLGVGFALPYLLIAARPEIARLLPKPGRWMAVVKFVLGLALLGTAIWLLGVLAGQIGPNGAIVVGAGLALASGLIWWRHKTSHAKRKPLLAGFATLAVLVALFAPGFAKPPANSARNADTQASGDTGLPWQSFAPDQIAKLVAQGKTVLVDITADWCVTCQVNKRLVIDTADVRAALDGDNIVLMQGDWTRPDPAIAAFLASYNRYGIPFNAVFGPAAPNGILMSELLSKDQVISGIATASGANGLAKN
ncbi:protein-disulfide reductase DsbD family protein [Thalassospira mesophila]|uniref:protein-disulfide reductase DsbD family protein n=1 Tax=Thalassospira mesophila TaxID=1293891 RepID=UPI001FE743A8|nr:thioredoxin family protein [Thalassospira mesophila]